MSDIDYGSINPLDQSDAGHVPVKSFAEITSCHTIHISDNYTIGGYRDDTEKSGICNNRGLTKGIKRGRNDSEATSSRRSYHGIQYLHECVPVVSNGFNVISKIGEGTFSYVYMAKVKDSPAVRVALKHLIPTSSTTRIENEIKCLKTMGGKANVIELKACIRCKDHVVLVMPYFPHDKFIDYLPNITLCEVRLYMYNLFQALRHIHSHRIIHRDIKPSNFLYHRDSKRFRLVDFGLAQQEPSVKPSGPANGILPPYQNPLISRRNMVLRKNHPPSAVVSTSCGNEKQLLNGMICLSEHSRDEICGECLSKNSQIASRAGTPGFRAPEVLMKCPNQSTAIDIWSGGVIFLSLLSGRYPFFRAHNDQSALAQIITLMGSKESSAVSESLGKELTCKPEVTPMSLKNVCCSLRSNSKALTTNDQPVHSNIAKKLCCDTQQDHDQLLLPDNCGSCSSKMVEGEQLTWEDIPDCVFDLLKQSLDMNPVTRVSATVALSHPFFIGMTKS